MMSYSVIKRRRSFGFSRERCRGGLLYRLNMKKPGIAIPGHGKIGVLLGLLRKQLVVAAVPDKAVDVPAEDALLD